jgi:hypothetical protein
MLKTPRGAIPETIVDSTTTFPVVVSPKPEQDGNMEVRAMHLVFQRRAIVASSPL